MFFERMILQRSVLCTLPYRDLPTQVTTLYIITLSAKTTIKI